MKYILAPLLLLCLLPLHAADLITITHSYNKSLGESVIKIAEERIKLEFNSPDRRRLTSIYHIIHEQYWQLNHANDLIELSNIMETATDKNILHTKALTIIVENFTSLLSDINMIHEQSQGLTEKDHKSIIQDLMEIKLNYVNAYLAFRKEIEAGKSKEKK